MTYEQLVSQRASNPLWKHFEIYRHSLWSLIQADQESRRRHILIATGRGGIGKSIVFQLMARELKVQYALMSSDTNPFRFVRQLFDNRKAHIIVLDDAGNMDSASAIGEYVKAAFGPERTVRHNIKGGKGDPPPPKVFKVNAALVWLTNKDFDDYNNVGGGKRPFAALLTRASVLNMDRGVTDLDVFRYTIVLATTTPMFEKARNIISLESKVNAINWFNDNRNNVIDLTPRTLDYVGQQFEQDRKRKQRNQSGPDLQYVLAALLSTSQLRRIAGFKKLNCINNQWVEGLQRDERGRFLTGGQVVQTSIISPEPEGE